MPCDFCDAATGAFVYCRFDISCFYFRACGCNNLNTLLNSTCYGIKFQKRRWNTIYCLFMSLKETLYIIPTHLILFDKQPGDDMKIIDFRKYLISITYFTLISLAYFESGFQEICCFSLVKIDVDFLIIIIILYFQTLKGFAVKSNKKLKVIQVNIQV